VTDTAYIALGSNLPSSAGSPQETLVTALVRLGQLGRLVACSSFYLTRPVGYAERSLGRDRSHGIANGPRTLDLDLILYGNCIIHTERLQLPHPRMAQRSFVLVPLAEIGPEVIHPESGKSMSQLLQDSPKLEEDFPNGTRFPCPMDKIVDAIAAGKDNAQN